MSSAETGIGASSPQLERVGGRVAPGTPRAGRLWQLQAGDPGPGRRDTLPPPLTPGSGKAEETVQKTGDSFGGHGPPPRGSAHPCKQVCSSAEAPAGIFASRLNANKPWEKYLDHAEGRGEPPDCSKIKAAGPPSPKAAAHLPMVCGSRGHRQLPFPGPRSRNRSISLTPITNPSYTRRWINPTPLHLYPDASAYFTLALV